MRRRPPTRARYGRVRAIAVAVMLAGVIGVGFHLIENHDAGPLDATYGDRWESLTEGERWWAAIS
jgi:hypothetical protein